MGSSQVPPPVIADVIGLVNGFFLNEFFSLRCWDSCDVDINSDGNFSVRSYHRIARGKIWDGCDWIWNSSCS